MVIKRFMRDMVVANISWAFNSSCAISHFNVTGKNPLGKMITDSTKKKHVVLYWLDHCYPLPFAVRAVSASGVDGETSEKFITFHEAPKMPTDVHVLRLGQTTWSVSWNDSSQCQNYSGYHYTAAVYDRQNQRVKEQNTTNRSTTLDNLDWCLEYWVRIRAIGSAGRSNESTAVKLQESSEPNTPTDVQVHRMAHTKWMISWNDSSECQNYPAYHYTVAVYDKESELVKEQNTTDRSTTLEGLDWCSEYWVRIRAIGPTGRSNESMAVKTRESVASSAPTDVQIHRYEHTKLMVSWNDSSECQNYSGYYYTVAVYDKQIQLVDEKNSTDLSMTLEDLDLCPEYWVTVRAVGPEGQSSESAAFTIYSPPAPSTPTNVQIRRYEHTKLMVSWNDSSECQNYSGYYYTVAVYDNQMQLADERNATDLSMTLEDLDMCSEYWVTVRAVGPEGQSSESAVFTIYSPPAPNKPTDIQLCRSEHTKWMVSWNDSSECQNYSGYHYSVAVYDKANQRVKEQNTTDRSTTLEGLDWCSEYWVRIQAIGPEGQSSESTAVKLQESVAPDKPTDIQLHRLEHTKWMVSWNDSSECQNYSGYHYTVTIYDTDNHRLIEQNTTNRSITMEALDWCSQYWVHIQAIGPAGWSNETTAWKLQKSI
ncbi:fibronectin type III domain protein, partial [Opisthorchis viverrini]